MDVYVVVLKEDGPLLSSEVGKQRLFRNIDEALEYLVYWSVFDGRRYRMLMYSGEARGVLGLSKVTWVFNEGRFVFSAEQRRALLETPSAGVAHVTSCVSAEIAFNEEDAFDEE
jgi:hypothetical protein